MFFYLHNIYDPLYAALGRVVKPWHIKGAAFHHFFSVSTLYVVAMRPHTEAASFPILALPH
jgi:hypothetical protein